MGMSNLAELSNIIGQSWAKKLISGAKAQGTISKYKWFFVGPPGVGKSMLCAEVLRLVGYTTVEPIQAYQLISCDPKEPVWVENFHLLSKKEQIQQIQRPWVFITGTSAEALPETLGLYSLLVSCLPLSNSEVAEYLTRYPEIPKEVREKFLLGCAGNLRELASWILKYNLIKDDPGGVDNILGGELQTVTQFLLEMGTTRVSYIGEGLDTLGRTPEEFWTLIHTVILQAHLVSVGCQFVEKATLGLLLDKYGSRVSAVAEWLLATPLKIISMLDLQAALGFVQTRLGAGLNNAVGEKRQGVPKRFRSVDMKTLVNDMGKDPARVARFLSGED